MNDFWEWMQQKKEWGNICDFLCSVNVIDKKEDNDFGLRLSVTPQMMIGYMIDYLFGHHPNFIPEFEDMIEYVVIDSTGRLFNILQEKIQNLNKK